MTMMLIIFVFQLGFIQYLAKVSKIGLGLTIYMEIWGKNQVCTILPSLMVNAWCVRRYSSV